MARLAISTRLAPGRANSPACAFPTATTCEPIPSSAGTDSQLYAEWFMHRVFLFVPAQAAVGQWLQSFKEFPIRQRPASFNVDDVMRTLSEQKN